MRRHTWWAGWLALSVGLCAWLALALTTEGSPNRAIFLPGSSTDGHHQIELACGSCHTPFEGVPNRACLACHGEDLAEADDSHPLSKFTDPRNAALVERLDATRCVTCHGEHAPAATRRMGVTMPDDYCVTCHADVGRERRSHEGMAFDTCASAGCHNYHDNTALYEAFLSARAEEPPLKAEPLAPPRTPHLLETFTPQGVRGTGGRLPADVPERIHVDPSLVAEWELTRHARAGVNCTGCHMGGEPRDAGNDWIDAPGERECAGCHGEEVGGFMEGKHGMRLNAGLGRMTPAQARLPMQPSAGARELSCSSCHPAHAFETREAAVEACLGCHDDGHSRAYIGSPHHLLWTRESEGAETGSGVSCATCHLPRQPRASSGSEAVLVQHNQSLNLRPNEKMARTVCLGCHGLGFSLDALADERLIAASFAGRPLRPVRSVEMAARRETSGTR